MSHRIAFGVAAAALMTIAACTEEPTKSELCRSSIDAESFVTPGKGQLAVDGSFYDDESLLLKYKSGGSDHVVVGAANNGRVTFSGLPSGTLNFDILVSCDKGQAGLRSGSAQIP